MKTTILRKAVGHLHFHVTRSCLCSIWNLQFGSYIIWTVWRAEEYNGTKVLSLLLLVSPYVNNSGWPHVYTCTCTSASCIDVTFETATHTHTCTSKSYRYSDVISMAELHERAAVTSSPWLSYSTSTNSTFSQHLQLTVDPCGWWTMAPWCSDR